METKYVVIYKYSNLTQTRPFPSKERAKIHVRSHVRELCDFYGRMGRKYNITDHDGTTVLILADTMETMSWTIEERGDNT